jgi:hypothetical protein
MLLNVPFAAGFAIWLAYGPPPVQRVTVPAPAAVRAARHRSRERAPSPAISDLVA